MSRVIKALAILGCLSFIFIGGLFLTIGLVCNAMEKDFLENGVPIKAEITDIEVDYYDDETDVYVTFEYNGKTYSMVNLNYSSSSMYEGQEIEVYFNPADEDIMYIEGNQILVIAFCAVGGLLCVIGIILLVVGLIVANVVRPVREYGIKYTGQVQQLQFVSYNPNGFQTYIVHCSYTDKSGATQYAKSGPVTINPSFPLPLGSHVDIYVDPKKNHKHFVDVTTTLNRIYAQQSMNYNYYNNFNNNQFNNMNNYHN